jgi:hypothetical protein
MNFRRSTVLLGVLITLHCCLSSTNAFAEVKSFTIDQAQSALTISATFSGISIQPQGPGSLTTSYTGNIEADVTDSTVAFVGLSVIDAVTNGTWEPGPGGTNAAAPADYGGQIANFLVNGKAAVRDVVLDVTSDVLPVSGVTFPAQGVQFNFVPTGTSAIDYTYSITLGSSGTGSQALIGSSTNSISTNATLVVQGSETVLTIPVDISGSVTVLAPNDLQYRFRGKLVGRASSASVPLQISSFGLAAGQLNFTIATTPGQSYTILGSSNLADWPTVIDQFTATSNSTERTVALPAESPSQYFRVRQD